MREDLLPESIRNKYEIYDYKNAISILYTSYNPLFLEICSVLDQIHITTQMIKNPGGSESEIPKLFSSFLRPLHWEEVQLKAETRVNDVETVRTETHYIDYVKGEVAFDLEWNSKDQTFDRDLYAFRSFFDLNKIGVGVIVTRSTSLHYDYFQSLGNYIDSNGLSRPIKSKYGASTTHMEKLLPRLHEGRSGGCPILAFGIKRELIIES